MIGGFSTILCLEIVLELGTGQSLLYRLRQRSIHPQAPLMELIES
jgi:hypothetical protein